MTPRDRTWLWGALAIWFFALCIARIAIDGFVWQATLDAGCTALLSYKWRKSREAERES